MANRIFKKLQGTLSQGVVKLFGKVVTSIAGAVSVVTAQGFTVTRTGVGLYKVALNDKYASLAGINVSIIGTATQAYRLANINVGAAAPYFEIQFAAELATDSTILLEVTLKNSSVA